MLDGIAGINQQRHTQRKIALLLKKSELLRRRVIIEDLKIIRVQVADEPAFLIGDREREIYFIHALGDYDARSRLRVAPASLNGFLTWRSGNGADSSGIAPIPVQLWLFSSRLLANLRGGRIPR